jgi:hypothetical protein
MTVMIEFNRGGDPITRLYAGLLARALCQTSQELMRARGKEIVSDTSPDEARVD